MVCELVLKFSLYDCGILDIVDLKESIEYLTKKYGDKEQRHQTLVRQLSHATEKVQDDYINSLLFSLSLSTVVLNSRD